MELNKDKQIKEVSKQRQEYLKFKPFADDLRKAESWCELDGVLNRYQTVKNLSKMGYRKASEVAREIIADLVKFADDNERHRRINGHSVWYIDEGDVRLGITDFIAELKKKYTEGGE